MSKLMWAGRGTAWRAASEMYCAAVPHPNPLPDTCGGHAFTDGVDGAGAVAVGNDTRICNLSRPALAALHVGGIDAGGRESHAYFAGARPRGLDLADMKNISGRTVLFVVGCAHRECSRLDPPMLADRASE